MQGERLMRARGKINFSNAMDRNGILVSWGRGGGKRPHSGTETVLRQLSEKEGLDEILRTGQDSLAMERSMRRIARIGWFSQMRRFAVPQARGPRVLS